MRRPLEARRAARSSMRAIPASGCRFACRLSSAGLSRPDVVALPEAREEVEDVIEPSVAERYSHVLASKPEIRPFGLLRFRDAVRGQIDAGHLEALRRRAPRVPSGAAPEIESASTLAPSHSCDERVDKPRRLRFVAMRVELMVVRRVEPGREPFRRHVSRPLWSQHRRRCGVRALIWIKNGVAPLLDLDHRGPTTCATTRGIRSRRTARRT